MASDKPTTTLSRRMEAYGSIFRVCYMRNRGCQLERNMLDIRSGLRSRTSSPYGPYSDESGTTEESEYSVKIGPEYQAVIPDLISEGRVRSEHQHVNSFGHPSGIVVNDADCGAVGSGFESRRRH
ncbi:hypothetical protein TNCV_4453211 [Trichonephila clavipes]|nr:hypothetical protein TNCV_4453211 [Trichonephila clavipes]